MTTTGARGDGADQDNPPHSRNPLSASSGDDSERSSQSTSTPTTTTNSDSYSTPTRGRTTTRYPESLGRVPLHRRGTSKTYERLEDLLREAGYKETRVFTPEAERNAKSTTEKQESGVGHGVRGGVGAVVDFFAGLVSRGSSLSREAQPLENGLDHAWSPPPSPSVRTVHAKSKKDTRPSSTISLSRNGSSDNLQRSTRAHVDLSADIPPKRTHAYHVVQRHQSSQGLPHHQSYSHPKPHYQQHHNHHHHHNLNNYASKSSIQPNPPNARAYLRHMVSAPNIQPLVKRPSLSEVSLRSHALGREQRASTRRTLILNDEDSIIESDYGLQSRVLVEDNEHEAHPPLPPMPRNWIDSVTKALLTVSGGPGAVTSDAASTKTSSTRKSSALSDKSNRQRRGRGAVRSGAGGAKPPLLCAQVQDLKAKTIEGQVSCTRVMCRSAPTSRANSRVRSGTQDDHPNGKNRLRRRGEDPPARSHRPRGEERGTDFVPSLAKTKVENDEWMAPRHRYLGGWGTDTSAISHPDGASSDESDDEDDEDDEGELGLDRLLVPARRQHSIQSLRRHLQRPRSQATIGRGMPPPNLPRSGRASPFGGATVGRQDLEDTSWGTSRGREWLASQAGEDGEEEGYAFSRSEVGSGRSSTRWRRGIPGPWVQWTTSS